METRPVIHPSMESLKAFGLGKLNDTSADALMNHLDQCADCCKVVAAQSGDDFLKRFRQARSSNSTPAPAKSLADVAKLPGRPTPLHNLPPELAAHPHYEILRELGQGGMGVVYLAKNKLMDRLEVLKVINKALLDRPGTIERFLREIRSAAKLSHANVVGAHSALQLGDVLAFAMEYVEGEDLAVLVKSNGPLPVANACYYIQQAALGLQHAFEKNMVHRDITPQNLILAREGKKHVVKILDFGLAKVIREKTEDTGLTGDGKMLGTPDYIAPEQTLDAASADIRADIYSLGCTLYYLLSGRPPFSAASLGAILLAHQMQEAKLLNLVRPEVPEELAAVVRKMMAKQPARRYQTPVEVARALAAFIKPGAQAGTTPKSSELSVGEPESKGGRSVAPAVENVRREAATPQLPPAAGWETLTGDSSASTEPRKNGVVRKRRWPVVPPTARKKWSIGVGVGVGVLVLALMALWAGGVFKVKTKDGTIVLENLPADAEVIVDGAKVLVKPTADGKPLEIQVASGKRTLEIKAAGFKIVSRDVTLATGERTPLRIHLEPLVADVGKRDADKPQPDKPAPPIGPPAPRSVALDALRREDISDAALAFASGGDPKRAPANLVAVLGDVLPLHQEQVNSLAFSGDGRWLASASHDKTIHLREAATGRVVRVLRGHLGPVSSVAFSKDSQTLVSASADGTLKLWPTEKEAPPQSLQAKLGEVWAMAVKPDGRFVAAGGAGGAVKLWKWGRWDTPVDVAASGAKVTALAFSPDGEHLAAGAHEQQPECPIRLYKTADGKLARSWTAHERSINVLTFSQDGKYLASTGGDKFVKVWKLASLAKPFFEIGNWTDFHAVAFSADGKILLAGLAGIACLFDLGSPKHTGRESGFGAVRPPPGGLGYRGHLLAAVYSADGKRLALGTGSGYVQVWDAATGTPHVSTGGHSHHVTTLAFGPDGRTILSGGDNFALRRWNLERPRDNPIVRQFDRALQGATFSPDGKKYATVASFEWYDDSQRGEIADAATDKTLFRVDPPHTSGSNIIFSPDAKTLAGCGRDGCVHLWDANNGKEIHRFPKIGPSLDSPAFSADGKFLAVATSDETKCIKVWDVASGEAVHSLQADPMHSVALSPDGQFLAAGHWNGTISLWNLADKGGKKRTLGGHSAVVTRLKFTADGKTLVSASNDGTLRLWNPRVERAMRQIISLGPANRPIVFDLDPSGRYLIAAGHGPMIYILRLAV